MAQVNEQPPVVAYFSMEIGLNNALPTFAGGLGILAGDSLLAAADLGIPMVGISLLYRKGYFKQNLDAEGNQTESPVEWRPEENLTLMPARVPVLIEGRKVWIQAWRYTIQSPKGSEIAVYFLDSALPENSPWDQGLTSPLYGGDTHFRLCQEVILGFGGIAMLRALGYKQVETYHMNEGHSALLILSLLKENAEQVRLPYTDKQVVENVRQQCVFTTHTSVPAGIDKFSLQLARQVLGNEWMDVMGDLDRLNFETLNMTELGIFFSRYVNGVSMRHEEVSSHLFPTAAINSVTNGIHGVTWTSEPFKKLYDRYLPEWRDDNLYLRYIVKVSTEDIHQAHQEAKKNLFALVEQKTGLKLNPAVMTIGFGRRMATYKRADFLFSDIERLKKIAREAGGLQLVYSGKAHPNDGEGKNLIRRVFKAARDLSGVIPVVFLENYDMKIAGHMCSGVDLWLNTPKTPEEASGTSGMKAAINGVPSFSTLDGWWVEGHIEGVTGWAIGDSGQENNEAASMYHKLESAILPKFYKEPRAYDAIMRTVIAVNASYYNTQRMMLQYLEHAYMPYK